MSLCCWRSAGADESCTIWGVQAAGEGSHASGRLTGPTGSDLEMKKGAHLAAGRPQALPAPERVLGVGRRPGARVAALGPRHPFLPPAARLPCAREAAGPSGPPTCASLVWCSSHPSIAPRTRFAPPCGGSPVALLCLCSRRHHWGTAACVARMHASAWQQHEPCSSVLPQQQLQAACSSGMEQQRRRPGSRRIAPVNGCRAKGHTAVTLHAPHCAARIAAARQRRSPLAPAQQLPEAYDLGQR